MKERPILFSGSMVKAILSGSKTQTRRVVKPSQSKPHIPPTHMEPYIVDEEQETDGEGRALWIGTHPEYPYEAGKYFSCPYGKPGSDRLWVRETWTQDGQGIWSTRDTGPNNGKVLYRADIGMEKAEAGWEWFPSIHMPRWASRITLEVTGVRVEKLQDISERDARTEGVEPYDGMYSAGSKCYKAYEILWDQINGKRYPWASNPFVWVVEFRKYEP